MVVSGILFCIENLSKILNPSHNSSLSRTALCLTQTARVSLSAVPHTLLYFARSQRADSDYDPCCCCCGNVSDENCLFSTISSKLFSIVVVPPPPPPTPSPAHHAPQLLHFSAKSAKKFPLVSLFYHVRDVGEHLHETGLLLPRLNFSELSFFYKGEIKDSNQFYKVWLLKRLSLNLFL